jgi:hypothetical protein
MLSAPGFGGLRFEIHGGKEMFGGFHGVQKRQESEVLQLFVSGMQQERNLL